MPGKDEKKNNLSIHEHAIAAKEYARERILQGSTQLSNNEIPLWRTLHHMDGISTKRNLAKNTSRNLSLESDPYVRSFEADILISNKLSIGNCGELAYQALDYFLTETDFRAEVYHIVNGDHVFLVVNRDPNSDPAKPETWGSEAFICDPWANKVFNASDYQSELKNYYGNSGFEAPRYEPYAELCNTEAFNPEKHSLAPTKNINTDYLRKHRKTENLKTEFEAGIEALKIYTSKLEALHRKLVEKYGENDTKAVVMANKITRLNRVQSSLKNGFEKVQNVTSYREVSTKLHRLHRKFDSALNSIHFDHEESNALFARRDNKSTRGKLMKAFDIPSNTEKKVKSAQSAFRTAYQKFKESETKEEKSAFYNHSMMCGRR
ncbi:hypothetical protein E3983_04850 [Legionella israelensis]|uniref:Dot/Icm T4SS effector n=1 Tax=Legionella israelensis TaxID=454 RepID=A0AAX1EFV1_9GAMM|nr:hypothetical protein [Legionella israelensis]QBR83742.1 hypothetical protein E3983_04850 [Legionella israelensis]